MKRPQHYLIASFMFGAAALAVVALTVGSATVAVAQKKAPPGYAQLVKEGDGIAQRLCVSCHIVGVAPEANVSAGVPTMRSIANRPDQSSARIRNALIAPHAPMPDVQLSNPEIDRLIAYIDSLRADSAGAPLVPRLESGEKPVYPDPT